MLVSLRCVLREGLNDSPDAHLLKGPAALLVNTQVAYREQSDASRRLRGTLVMRDDIKQLLESPVSDEVFT